MAFHVDKEANSRFSNGSSNLPPSLEQNGKENPGNGHLPAKESPQMAKKSRGNVDLKVADILSTFHKQPLISNEIALNLLKIQSKFVSSHPCLCTSRFRHTLHQLDEESHQDLDRLCSQLSIILKLEDDENHKEKVFNSVLPCVFGDIGSLEEKTTEWLIRSGQNQDQESCSGQKNQDQEETCCSSKCLSKKLNGILSRLVTDYRAIFAIEVEFSRSFEKSDDELHPTEHHRKRHEEVDSCPEEIKLMKVACEELSLECTATSPEQSPMLERHLVTTPGPKFCLKSLTSQGVPEKDNSIHRHPEQGTSHNAALEDLRSRHHHRGSGGGGRGHHFQASEKGSQVTSVKVVPSGAEVETDSTPVSSDVEAAASPRRSCQRKRKERRDSIGEGQDKKFSKSSSDVFPTTTTTKLSETANQEESDSQTDLRKVQSTIDFVTANNNQEACTEDASNMGTKCTFYVSDDELAECAQDGKNGERQTTARAIMRPRRSRKVRTDSLKENQGEEQEQTAKDILPWKKNAQTPPSLSTPPPISTSSVFSLVASVKSSIVQASNNSIDGDDGSDSTSSSASDETCSNLDVEEDLNKSPGRFSVRHMNNSSPVQDSNHHMYQPVAWEPYGSLWKSTDFEQDHEAKLEASEFQNTRHFGMIHSKQHLDRSHVNHWNSRSASTESGFSETRSKIKQLSKQVSVMRKKIEEFESKFEEAHGYRPSQAEKQSNKEIRKLILQQNKLKRQIRILRESGDSGVNLDHESSPSMSPNRPWSPACSDFANLLNVYSDSSNDCSNNGFERFKNLVKDIEDKLDQDRKESGRPQILEDMSMDQVLAEKSSIQTALSKVQQILNKSHQTCKSDEAQILLRDLLSRYRSVKRIVRRSSNILIKDPCELETIPEGSEIQLTLASPQHRINIEMNNSRILALNQNEIMPSAADKKCAKNMPSLPDTEEIGNNQTNLHAMSRAELLTVQKTAKEEKKQLRRWLKEREFKFLEANGRPMPKEELKDHDVYSKYKMTKAKLKLVDALLSKKP